MVIPPKKAANKEDSTTTNKLPKVKQVSNEKDGNVAEVLETDKSNKKSSANPTPAPTPAPSPAPTPAPSPAPAPAPTPAPKPTRALNDPRYKSE